MIRAAAAFLSICILPLAAQTGRGTILGSVTDASGAAVGGAKVSIVNVGTNSTIAAITNAQGFYTTPAINPGNYRVTVEREGFKKEVRSGISLQVDQSAEINVHLQVGATTESVNVVAEAPQVNLDNPAVGTVIDNDFVNDLPLDGGNALALVLLANNVHSNAGPVQSGFGDRGTSLSDLSINGGPNAANNLQVDGMVGQNSYYPDLNSNLGVDAVQEFKVQSGAMSAEYGFTLGGVINMATKGGTNQYHGSANEFFRNDFLDARYAFSTVRPPYRYNQYGATVGGPLQIPHVYNGKNKSFFFVNWGGYNYITYGNSYRSLPPLAERTGNFSQLRTNLGVLTPIYDTATTQVNPNGTGYVRQPFAGNIIPASRLDPVAQNVNKLYPDPNVVPVGPDVFTQSNNYLSINRGMQHMKQWTIREDQQLSPRDTMFARFTHYNAYTNNCPCTYPSFALNGRYDNFGTTNISFSETHTFSSRLINELRVGVARQHFPFQSASFGEDWPKQLGLPSNVPNDVFPTIANGYTALGNGTVGFRGAITWDMTDSLTLVMRKHTLKMGVEYRILKGNNYQTSAPSGSFNFSAGLTGNPQSQTGTGSTYAGFLLGAVSSASGVTNVGESEKGYTLSGFVQDTWRLRRNFNVNMGLRYDYQQPAYEANCGSSNFNPAAKNPLTGLKGRMDYACQDYGNSYANPNYYDFGPRIGFVWDPFSTGKMAIRGGYAIFYPGTFNITYFGSTSGFASTSTAYSASGGNNNFPAFYLKDGFPTPLTQPLGSVLGPSAFLSQGVTYDQADQKTPSSQQWNFGIQRQIRGGWVFDMSYTGNRGNHLVAGGYNMNQLNPQYDTDLKTALQNTVPNPYANIVPGSLGAATITRQQSLLPYPYYTSITVRNPHLGNSIYNAGLLTVQKRMSKGLSLLVSYTKAKLIDDSVASPINFGNIEQVTSTGYQNGSYNRGLERALDPTNVAQRLSISSSYKIPIGKGQFFDPHNRLVDAIIGGWQSQAIVTLQKGLPVLITGANNNLANRPNSTGKSAKLDNPNQYRWFDTSAFVNPPTYTFGNIGRTLPDVTNPGFFNCDLSLIKNTQIMERIKAQLRIEAFNVDNHTNPGFVNGSFSSGPNGLNQSSTFGTIVSGRAPRIVQLGLKLYF